MISEQSDLEFLKGLEQLRGNINEFQSTITDLSKALGDTSKSLGRISGTAYTSGQDVITPEPYTPEHVDYKELPDIPQDEVQVGRIGLQDRPDLKQIDLSVGAYDRLLEAGLNLQEIQSLRRIMNGYEYGGCSKKLEYISRRPIYVKNEGLKTEVSIPFFNDYMGRQDGQCGDLAQALAFELRARGILEKTGLELIVTSGNSPKFFRNPSRSNHIWITAIDNKNDSDEIIIDPSLGLVTTYTESSYKVSGRIDEVEGMERNPTMILEVGELDTRFDPPVRNLNTMTVLGITNDRQSVVALGFMKWQNLILPCLKLIKEDDTTEVFAYIDPKTGELYEDWLNNEVNVTRQQEIRKMFQHLNKLQVKDISTAPEFINKSLLRRI